MTKQIRIYLFLFLATLLAGLPAYGQEASSIITLTTTKRAGEHISLSIFALGDYTIEGAYHNEDETGNYKLTAQQVTVRGNVTSLFCNYNELTSLNISGCTALRELDCSTNQLTSLNLSGCTALTELNCRDNQLTNLNVSGCTALTELNCRYNKLKTLNISGCTALTTVDCSINQMTSLDVTGCTALTTLDCGENKLTNLSTSGCTALTTLDCSKNELTNLCISGCTELTTIFCDSNQLKALDVSGCTALRELNYRHNQLQNLNISGCTALTTLDCSVNQMTSLDVSGCTALITLNCYGNQLRVLDTSKNTALETLYLLKNQLISLDLSKNTALTSLDCRSNQLTALDISKNTALTSLYCGSNQLTALDISKNTALTSLYCSENQLTALDISKNTALTSLDCSENQLTSLDLSKNTALDYLSCNANQLTTLDVSNNTALERLACYGNQIKGEEMTRLVNSLSNRTYYRGSFVVVQEPGPEGNICLKSDVAIAKAKNWKIQKYNTDEHQYFAYEGEDPISFVVTLKKEGEGTLNATGADNLNAVEYGTELTIEATPAEGYTLVALTANSADILATKKVVVKGATEIKATFAKKTFGVTLTHEGEGTLNATGADNLNAVKYGTELTIEATTAEGYTLVALTANGTDILATKKIVVKEATEVKATFAKKTFGVTLTHEGEGTLDATGADDLNAVPFGTELTIKATPAAGYELKALTANGADILTAKKFVVKGATEIEATFTKKTATDRVEAGSVRLYPNPASTYVNVKAAKADALVRLYDANGTLLYEARTDDHGMLQIELSAYAEGTYLLLVDGNAQRLLIQR